mgnify:CR=1 FL=1
MIALLPDDDTVVRYFNSPRSDQKVAPFVIARNVTSSEFGALLDALETAAEPPVYWADLDLDFNGTLQVHHFCRLALITDIYDHFKHRFQRYRPSGTIV